MKTKTRTKHTAGPWASEPALSCTGKTRMITKGFEIIAEIGNFHRSEGENNLQSDIDTHIANAEFIVQACNSHEALLAACRAASLYFRTSGGGSYDGNDLINLIDDAIAAAEGGP